MADQNNLDIRARLTAEDNASATVTKLLAKIKSLEDKFKQLGKIKTPIGDIPYEDVVKGINKAGKSLDGLTKKHLDWARAQKANNELNDLGWTRLTNNIRAAARAYDQATNKTGKDAAEKQLRMHYKNAQAFRYLYNRTAQDQVDIQRRVNEEIGNLNAAHLRNEERSQSRHLLNLARNRRDAMRGIGRMGDLAGRASFYAAAGAGATGAAGASAFARRMKVDTAETNLSMFGGISPDQVKSLRREWTDAASVKFGAAPEAMIDALTETLKAGVPQDKARQVTESIMESATGLDLDIKNTTRFATRIATLTGDMSNLDPAKIKSILNAVAVVGRESAADSNEIIAANRRASGVFSMSKMTPEQLSAFTGAGISADMPSGKTGTFLSFMVSELVGGKNARGQRAQDLNSAASALGMGGRSSLSKKMAEKPADTLLEIFNRLGAMDEQKRAKVSNQLGMREWRDEIGTFVQVRDDVARFLKAINDPKNKTMVDETITKKLQSLAARWGSIVAAWKLLWESVGSGLEKSFREIADFFTNYAGKFDKSKITKAVESFVDGMVAGLGFKSITEMLQAAFGNPDDIRDWSSQMFSFAKGFVSGLKDVADKVIAVMKAIAPGGGNDPEALGKLIGHLSGLVVVLGLLAPVVSVMGSIISFLSGLASVLGLPGMLALAATVANKAGVADSQIRKPGESYGDWQTRRRDRYKKSSGEGFDPTMVHPMSYRSSVDDLSDQLRRFGGTVERASFISQGGALAPRYGGASGGGGGFSYGGGSGGISSSSGLGSPSALLNSVPGAALPGFGVGRSGSILRTAPGGGVGSTNIPAGGVADMSVGQGLNGSAFLAARRSRFGEEMKNDPNLRMHLAAMQMTEGVSKGGTIESLMNRMDMQGSSLRNGLGYGADGQINPKSFYGPVRRGELGPAIAKLRANPKLFQYYDGFTQRALDGSHAVGGYTDQGLPTDPNGSARTGIPGFKIGPRDGNEFTDWVGPGSSFGRGRAGAMNYRRFIEKNLSNEPTGAVPSASDAIRNVPAAPSSIPGAGAGDIRSGPVAININGNSHDPEALATLVQRRVDESMNFRAHDTEYEYS